MVAETTFDPTVSEARVPVVTPFPCVVSAGCVSVFPAPVADNTTVAPLIRLPLTSLAVTVIVAGLEPEDAVMDVGDAVTDDCAADTASAFPVTEKLTVVRPPEVAWTVFVPAAVPRVHVVSAACPVLSVLSVAGEAGLIDPLPPVTVNATLTFPTGLPWLSVTSTAGGVTEVPTVAEAGGVLAAVMLAAVPALAVARKVADPAVDVTVSVSVLAELPSVQPPMVAIPFAPVVCVPPVTVPFDAVAVKVTVTPESGLLNASCTMIEGAMAMAVATDAV